MKTITDMLQLEFGEIHAKFKTVSIVHLKELQTEINEWKQNGLITEKFYKQNYGGFVFQPPVALSNTNSIIVIGAPQKMIPLEFSYKGKKWQIFIPPTYSYSKIRNICTDILSRVLEKERCSIERAILPMKLLAVRSGLGKYGKNNICYIKEMGSFVRLEAFYTDYKFPDDDWCEKGMMESCKNCSLCQNACPTRCIPKERFLIHADRCLTYLNENKEDFPSWVAKYFHNALVGCMRCQLVCPQNKSIINLREKLVCFSEEEISMILSNTPQDQISEDLSKKLVELNMDEYYPLLSRNLSVLIDK